MEGVAVINRLQRGCLIKLFRPSSHFGKKLRLDGETGRYQTLPSVRTFSRLWGDKATREPQRREATIGCKAVLTLHFSTVLNICTHKCLCGACKLLFEAIFTSALATRRSILDSFGFLTLLFIIRCQSKSRFAIGRPATSPYKVSRNDSSPLPFTLPSVQNATSTVSGGPGRALPGLMFTQPIRVTGGGAGGRGRRCEVPAKEMETPVNETCSAC